MKKDLHDWSTSKTKVPIFEKYLGKVHANIFHLFFFNVFLMITFSGYDNALSIIWGFTLTDYRLKTHRYEALSTLEPSWQLQSDMQQQ